MVVLFGFYSSVLLVVRSLHDFNLCENVKKLYLYSTYLVRLVTGIKMTKNTVEPDVSDEQSEGEESTDQKNEIQTVNKNQEKKDTKEQQSKQDSDNKYCRILKDFEMKDDGEIDVIKGDVVKVICLDKQWAEVEKKDKFILFKNGITGKIPIDCIGDPLPNISVKTIAIGVVICSVLIYWSWPIAVNYSESKLSNYMLSLFSSPKSPCDLFCEVSRLEKRFCSQSDDLWISLLSCLKSTISQNQPCIITLLNGGNDDLFGLHKEIGDASARLLGTNQNVLLYEGSKLASDNFSFDECKENLIKHKVMVVSEMDKMPGDVLTKFHAFCDIHDAAVQPAVIIFMLNHKYINVEDTSNENTLALSIISKHWGKSIHPDIIDALSVRVLDYTVKVNPENKKC